MLNRIQLADCSVTRHGKLGIDSIMCSGRNPLAVKIDSAALKLAADDFRDG
jgi:hypothetical protein